jgi:Ca2+:H+ antiporter
MMAKIKSDIFRHIWRNFPLRTGFTTLDPLLLVIPVTFVLDYWPGANPLWLFASSTVAIVPLAAALGQATEELSAHMGPSLGGLLNATLGNSTELIIGFFMLRAGQLEVVKASLSGSIVGNALLVLGMSALCGGLRHGRQTFSRTNAQINSTMLFVAVAALVTPAIFSLSAFGHLREHEYRILLLSRWTSIVLILIYSLGLLETLRRRQKAKPPREPGEAIRGPKSALAALSLTTILLSFMSNSLVKTIEAAKQGLGLSNLFMGVVVIAIVGNVAEHTSAIMMAQRNKMEATLAITIGSGAQIALLVAPLLVLLSWAIRNPMSLLFSPLEIAGIGIAVLAVTLVGWDGETTWFDGVQLLAIYLIFALAMYLMPA